MGDLLHLQEGVNCSFREDYRLPPEGNILTHSDILQCFHYLFCVPDIPVHIDLANCLRQYRIGVLPLLNYIIKLILHLEHLAASYHLHKVRASLILKVREEVLNQSLNSFLIREIFDQLFQLIYRIPFTGSFFLFLGGLNNLLINILHRRSYFRLPHRLPPRAFRPCLLRHTNSLSVAHLIYPLLKANSRLYNRRAVYPFRSLESLKESSE